MSELERRIRRLSTHQRVLLRNRLASIVDVDVVNHSNEVDVNAAPELVAHVTLTDGCDATTLTTAQLTDQVASRLPSSMIPASYRVVSRVPRLPNGKVDRRGLAFVPATEIPSADIGDSGHMDFAEPRTATELQLAQIWSDVLGCGMVSVHDRFFEIGGDSLLVIQVVFESRASAARRVSQPDIRTANDLENRRGL